MGRAGVSPWRAGAVVVASGLLAGCGLLPSNPPVPAPIRWESDDGIAVYVEEDGAANVADLPLGQVSGRGCTTLEPLATPVSGAGIWTEVGEYAVEVRVGASTVRFEADTDLLSLADWSTLILFDCAGRVRLVLNMTCWTYPDDLPADSLWREWPECI